MSQRLDMLASADFRCLVARILDRNLPDPPRLAGADLDLGMLTQRCQETHRRSSETSVNFPLRIFDSSDWVVPIRRATARCVKPRDLRFS